MSTDSDGQAPRLAVVRRAVPDPDATTGAPSDHASPAPARSEPAEARRVLIIAADDLLARRLSHRLLSAGYEVEIAADGDTGLGRVTAWPPHAVVSEIALPDVDGFDLCRSLTNRAPLPLVVLLFGPEDLEAIVAVLGLVLKRRDGEKPGAGQVRFEDVVIDLDHGRAHRGGVLLPFTQKDMELLRFLVTHPKQVFTRDQLLQMVWGYHEAPLTRTVDTHIARLRQKLEADPHNPRYIQTIYGTGYAFIP